MVERKKWRGKFPKSQLQELPQNQRPIKVNSFTPEGLVVLQEYLPLQVASFSQDTRNLPGSGNKSETGETTEKEDESGWCLECSHCKRVVTPYQ